jgi:hypothetical protein
LTLAFDMDGCLANFNSSFIPRIIEVTGEDRFGRDTTWDEDFPPEFNYPQAYGYTPQQLDAVWRSIRKDESFWYKLEALPSASEYLAKIAALRDDGIDTYFITHREGRLAKRQTERWLEDHGMPGATVLLTGDKATACDLLRVDAYIDDKLAAANEVMGLARIKRTLQRVYLMHAPYNNRPVATLGDQQYRVTSDERDPGLIVVRSVGEMLEKEGF